MSSIEVTRSAREQWPRVNLGDLCQLVNGGAYRESDWSAAGVPIIRIQNLNNHSKTFNYWSGSLDGHVIVNDDDVLLAWSGTPGTSFGAHIWERGLGILNQHIFRVDLDRTRIDPHWAVFAINEQLDEMIGRAHGAVGLRHVTRKEVESLSIPLPPLADQQRIAGRLREQLAEVAKARTAVQAQLAAAQAYPAAILRHVFNSPNAESWPRRCLGDVCELLPSKSICLTADAEVRAITTASLTETGFDPAGIKTGRMWSSDVPDCTVRAGEILIARSNTPDLVGRVALFNGESPGAVASDLTIRIWPGDEIHGEFLTRYLSALYLTGYWRERAGGASGSMKKITRSQILAEKVPVPLFDEQECVATRLAAELAAVTRLRESLSGKLEAIDRLPAALLAQAFQGTSE